MSDNDAPKGTPVMAAAVTSAAVERRLAAIVSADVVGYSRLMGADETGTLARLKAHRQELVDPTVAKWHGRVVKLMGDGILIEFASAVDAVSCAIEVQQAMLTRNENVPELQKVVFRVGINLGDIIIEGEDIYGDGVNIAARLEALAKPGSVYISEDIYRQVRGKLSYGFDDLGAHRVKNISEPVQVYQVILGADTSDPPGSSSQSKNKSLRRAALAVSGLIIAVIVGAAGYWQAWKYMTQPAAEKSELTGAKEQAKLIPPNINKPSIAVLPFANMSADPEQEYFADGMTEDLITDLSKVSGLFVIARNSAFVYKGQAINIQKVGQELNVRYVLEGSVRKAGDRIRINAQLIDAVSGGHLWAERYDRQLADIFDLQDEVRTKIVNILSVTLTAKEQQLLEHRYTNDPGAYEYFLRGQSLERTAGYLLAREMYRNAIELDPGFARAYGALAMTYTIAVFFGQSTDIESDLEQALVLAHKAVAMDNALPQTHWVLGFTYLFNKQHDQALDALDRAIELDANYTDAYAVIGQVYAYMGKVDEALLWLSKAIQLNPDSENGIFQILGGAYYGADRFDESIVALQTALERNPESYPSRLYLAAAYIRLGQQDEAEWEAMEVLNQLPDFSVRHWGKALPFKDPAQLNRLLDDLRRAGFPE